MAMRVALDAGFLALPPSGTGVYVRELAAALPVAADLAAMDLDLQLLRPSTVFGNLPPLQRLGWESTGAAFAASRLRPKPDLVHIPHQMPPMPLPEPFGLGQIPFVLTIHDVVPFVLPEYRARLRTRIRLAAVRRLLPNAQLVLVPSKAAAAEVTSVLNIPAERIRVTPEAVNSVYRPAGAGDRTEAARILARFGITGPYVFNVGGFDARKNLIGLLYAFSNALPRLDSGDARVSLVIAGAPHSNNALVFPPLEPIIDGLGLRGRVILTGRVNEIEKLTLYQGAAAYCTPSLYEGFGLTALEAMACGVPTIVSDRTSMPEVVGDGGLIVSPKPGPLADALVQVLTDPAEAKALSDRGIRRAAHFSWAETARLTLAAYQEVVGSVD